MVEVFVELEAVIVGVVVERERSEQSTDTTTRGILPLTDKTLLPTFSRRFQLFPRLLKSLLRKYSFTPNNHFMRKKGGVT